MEYLGGLDAMQMVYDQMKMNPRIEINNIKTVKWPLKRCFENCDMKEMKWDGQELQNRDTIYWMDQHCTIFKVRIFVGKMDPEESRMATINANIHNHIEFKKAQRKAQICNGACDVPFAQEGE